MVEVEGGRFFGKKGATFFGLIRSLFKGKNSKISTNVPTEGRKFNQLSRRGWNQDSINDLVNNPHTTRESINRATGNKATAYFREDGHYVVRDDVTGDIVQMRNGGRA